jgi:hypothetical protein
MADLFDQETVTARIEGADTVVGTIYRIVSRVTLDFTTVGSPDNTVGTVFIADAVDTLGSGDALSEITAPHKGTIEWPYLAGDEAITDSDDRDFGGGDIGNWVVNTDGTGTVTYSAADLDGADDKQGLITAAGDESFLYAELPCSASGGGGDVILTPSKLTWVSVKIYTPAANTLQDAILLWRDITGEIPVSIIATIPDNAYTILSGFFSLAADVVGNFQVGFDGAPTAGDLLYIDDISIRPVQFSWIPYSSNLMEIDEAEDALKITYVNFVHGGFLQLRDTADLSVNLTIGQSYILTFDGKVGAGDTVKMALNDGVGVLFTGNIAETFTMYTIIFTAKHATNCHIYPTNLTAGEEVWIRNITLREKTGGGGHKLKLRLRLT